MKLTQHVPGCVDMDEEDRVVIDFTSADELMAHPWMIERTKREGFFQYSLSRENILMAEYNEGQKWWVVGYLTEGDVSILNLPQWNPPVSNVAKQSVYPRKIL